MKDGEIQGIVGMLLVGGGIIIMINVLTRKITSNKQFTSAQEKALDELGVQLTPPQQQALKNIVTMIRK